MCMGKLPFDFPSEEIDISNLHKKISSQEISFLFEIDEQLKDIISGLNKLKQEHCEKAPLKECLLTK